MGYGELIRVLGEEAAREARELRAAAEREAARIVGEAHAAADAARSALVARERSEADARRRAALEALALERDRVVLGEQRRILDEVRAEAARRLLAPAGPEVLERLLREVLAEAGDGPFELEVDPGEEEICRRLLARQRPDLASRAEVRAAAAPRGGVALIDGRRVLDDTLPARLERAWPGLEPALVAILFGGG
jgi:V/A-type H+/Na+-transporting ATPase subunit E